MALPSILTKPARQPYFATQLPVRLPSLKFARHLRETCRDEHHYSHRNYDVNVSVDSVSGQEILVTMAKRFVVISTQNRVAENSQGIINGLVPIQVADPLVIKVLHRLGRVTVLNCMSVCRSVHTQTCVHIWEVPPSEHLHESLFYLPFGRTATAVRTPRRFISFSEWRLTKLQNVRTIPWFISNFVHFKRLHPFRSNPYEFT